MARERQNEHTCKPMCSFLQCDPKYPVVVVLTLPEEGSVLGRLGVGVQVLGRLGIRIQALDRLG